MLNSRSKGIIEQFNGDIGEGLAGNRPDSRADLKTTIKRYCHLYNHYIPQNTLAQRRHSQAMKALRNSHSQLFMRHVHNHVAPDN